MLMGRSGRHVGNVDAMRNSRPSVGRSNPPASAAGWTCRSRTPSRAKISPLWDVERHVVDRQRFVELLAYPVYFDQHFFTLLAAPRAFL